tara:strand:- start:1757 stop:1915 length:159 start_codon:yes stop_codon:yes gene_type:complete
MLELGTEGEFGLSVLGNGVAQRVDFVMPSLPKGVEFEGLLAEAGSEYDFCRG